MNKLEAYRDKKASSNFLRGDFPLTMENAFQQGFDAAIALDLPVKFAEWKEDHPFTMKNLQMYQDMMIALGRNPTIKDLYQYWIDNVFKMEE